MKGSDDMAVSVLQGVIKEAELALEKMRLEALCKTCCLVGMIKRPNLIRKSLLSKGVAMAANKKSNLKFVLKNKQKIREMPKQE